MRRFVFVCGIWLALAFGTVITSAEEPPVVRLTETPDIQERQPAWSPDGQWIAFTDGSSPAQDLWILSADGKERRRLTEGPEADLAPSWSPDGKRLAFSSSKGAAAPTIWMLTLDDSTLARATNEKGRTLGPAWSPDGKEILYYGISSGDEQIWSAPVLGGEPRRLTRHATQSWSGSWSPDGKWVVFSGYRNTTTGGSLFVMPRQGEGISCENSRPLTHRVDHRWDRFTAWSPDGQWIAFSGQSATENWDIWLVSEDGKTEVRVTEDPAEDLFPSWGPDSRRLVFQSDRSGNNDLWTLNTSRWTAPQGK